MPRYYTIYGPNKARIPLYEVRVDAAKFVDRLNGKTYVPTMREWTAEEQQFIDLVEDALFVAAIDNATIDSVIETHAKSGDDHGRQLAAFFTQLKAERGAVSVYGYWVDYDESEFANEYISYYDE